ncbi:pentatricopeptide repeat-containing protein At5g43790-like [Andrographis paniculata]|uniref:pentatricopeptide repeat-containing protein At5g43790-like n=1 Tax=Andrographis paniculata TaxID=175694 RepID=UPI0021E8510C|nr:pentatricopeptide repeat-containing protein At5g43790-like [Andrographis paniculata]
MLFIAVFKCIRGLSSPPSNLSKTVNYTSPAWAENNQLYQRHRRLYLFEQQWSKAFHQLKLLVSYLIVSGLNSNPFVMSRVLYLGLVESEGVDMVEKSEFGVKIFNRIENPNLFSWNTMIRFFASFDPVVASNYYRRLLFEEMVPDEYTFPFLLQASGATFDVEFAKQVHCQTVKLLLDHNLFVQNSLLNSYMVCGSTPDARQLFDEMPEKDVVSWTSLISGLVSQSHYIEAIHVFKNLVCNDSRPEPNNVTIISTMSACGHLGYTDLTRCFHAMLEKGGWLNRDMMFVNSVIDAYCKCGDLSYIRNFLTDSGKWDLYSLTAVISGLGVHGRGQDALYVFLWMEKESGIEPDDVTFVAVLSACAHSGLVEEGLIIFESMSGKHGIKPDLRHYGCIVDLLSRSGMLERAYDIVQKMPVEPNLAVLGSLLNGCRLHGELELGEAVLRKIELLDERGGASVLLSNMYADKYQWGRVMEVRRESRIRTPAKFPGRSWIRSKGKLREFVARNDVDPQGMELVLVLEGLEKHSKL